MQEYIIRLEQRHALSVSGHWVTTVTVWENGESVGQCSLADMPWAFRETLRRYDAAIKGGRRNVRIVVE